MQSQNLYDLFQIFIASCQRVHKETEATDVKIKEAVEDQTKLKKLERNEGIF